VKRAAPLRHLSDHGCALLREGGRHSIWKNPRLDRLTAVPRHAEVNDNLARKICKDLGIEPPKR
jgi:mRNA interferase HicA